jgi:hypothetical protein
MKRISPAFAAPLALLGKLLLGAMLVFHGWLLAKRLASGELFDSGAAWRWLGAAGLLFFWALQRRLAKSLSPRARRRSGLAFWSLVLVLHAGAPMDGALFKTAGHTAAALPLAEIGSFALPLLAAFLLLETARRLAGAGLPSLLPAAARSPRRRFDLSAGYLPQVSCRPPPVR